MKKLLIITMIIIVIFSNTLFANVYDLSQISQAKLVAEYSEDTTVDQMDTVTFGSYYQSNSNTKEPIEWIVLARQNNKALLLSKYILDEQSYSITNAYQTWANCILREWLNNNFYNSAFDENEKRIITKRYLTSVDVSGFKDSNENSLTGLYDYVFILDHNELENYFKIDEGLEVTPNAIGKNTKRLKVSSYWVRGSTGIYNSALDYGASYVTDEGFYDFIFASNQLGIRPAIWVDYSSVSIHNTSRNDITSNNKSNIGVGTIAGMPSRQAEWRSDQHFYLDDSMQRNKWVYYVTDYYHVDANGDIEKNKWIDQRYVGNDGKMYRGRQTPDGQYVGDNGYVVNVVQDLFNSVMTKTADPDSWYQTQSGLWYYFENDRTTTKKGWFKDYRDDQWYYFDLITGIMQVGWQKIDGKDYYFNEFHTGNNWYEVGGGFFESYGKKVKAYGSMFKSEKTPDGYWVNWNGEYIKNGNFFLAINPITYLWIVLVVLIIIIVVYYLRKKNIIINDLIVAVINKIRLITDKKATKSK